MKDNNRPIGIFDSGIGGLTVVREIRKYLPGENIIYLGDTARVPYGNKSEETIKKFGLQDAQFLLGFNVKLIIVACNTVSSVALDYLRERLSMVPIFGVVEPGVRIAMERSRTKKVGVIGTIATIKSEAHKRHFAKGFEVYGRPCPLFVPLAEEGITTGSIAEQVAEMYLAELRDKVDTVILGCTHYPLLKGVIRKVLGEAIALVDPAEEVAKEVGEFLRKEGLISSRGGTLDIFLTDIPPHYVELIERFLGERINSVKKVEL
ncbi:MAG: glutamate racemase [candidate division WOR-3 bacterium]